jgi:O-succinylbenzoate synthase
MFKASYIKHNLKFKTPAGTSRGVLTSKDSYYLKLQSKENPSIFGIGEASPLQGLSVDNFDSFEEKIKSVCDEINKKNDMPEDLELNKFPAIEFALETAILDLENGGQRKVVDTPFFDSQFGIDINGLVWMSDKDNMRQQIKEKISQGFDCIKLKIGALNFEDELDLLKEVRKDFSEEQLQIRLDANGAFKNEEALEKLKRLSEFDIHSIEQPIKQGQWGIMANLCKNSPIDIALDEELIGVNTVSGKQLMLQIIKPQYLILKPTLLGGFQSSQEWIEIAMGMGIDWWVTSALESNIGLNAISQWTSSFNLDMYQGLGTGQLFENNIDCPLEIKDGKLFYNNKKSWDLSLFK